MLNWRIIVFWLLFGLASCTNQHNFAPVVNAWDSPIAKQGDYKVQTGDTLYSIAWRYGLDYRTLAEINHLKPPYHVSKGQSIYIKSFHHPTIQKTPLLLPAKSRPLGFRWRWPLKGQIIKSYSLGENLNKGIDIKGDFGQPVVAAAPGTVVYSGNGLKGYGNLIIIKHSEDYLSAYANNDKNLVKEDETVMAGQKIAMVGHSASPRNFLHFEIRYQGNSVNPLKLLPVK